MEEWGMREWECGYGAHSLESLVQIVEEVNIERL